MKLILNAYSVLAMAFVLSAVTTAGAQTSAPPAMVYGDAGIVTASAMAAGQGHNMVYARSFRMEDNKVVAGAPYSAQAVTETTQVLSDGNRIDRKDTAQVYRDSKGRTRRDLSLSGIGPWSAPGGPMQMVNIFDPVAGLHYMLNVQEKKAYKMPPPRTAGARPLPPPPPGAVTFVAKGGEFGHSTTVSLGNQEIEGVEAQGTRTTETIPAGQIGNERPIVITTERWYSPELQVDVLLKHSDPRMGDMVYQLTDITREEPDPSLFQVPSDYTVVQKGPITFQKRLQ